MSLMQQLFSNQDRTVLDLIPIVDYQDGCFLLRNGKVMDIVQIKTRDFTTASEDDIDYDNLSLVKFFRLYGADMKIVCLSFPTDTKEQQQYFERKIAQTKNEVFKYYLNYKLEELRFIEKNRTDLEFYIFIWAKDKAELRDRQIIIQRSLGVGRLSTEIEDKKKLQILFKIANKNTGISG